MRADPGPDTRSARARARAATAPFGPSFGPVAFEPSPSGTSAPGRRAAGRPSSAVADRVTSPGPAGTPEIRRRRQRLQRIALWPTISASRSMIDQNPICPVMIHLHPVRTIESRSGVQSEVSGNVRLQHGPSAFRACARACAHLPSSAPRSIPAGLTDEMRGSPLNGARASVMAAFERKIKKLEEEPILPGEKIARAGKPKHTFEELFELAMRFPTSHWNICKNSGLAAQITVLRLAFAKPVGYCRNPRVRTRQFLSVECVRGFFNGEI